MDGERCESHGPGSFTPGRKDPGFVLQRLWNEAIIPIAVYISNASEYKIIWTENSELIDSLILEILKYKFWIFASWRERCCTVRLTPA